MRILFFHLGEEPSGVDAGDASLETVISVVEEMRETTGLRPRITIVLDNEGKVASIRDEEAT